MTTSTILITGENALANRMVAEYIRIQTICMDESQESVDPMVLAPGAVPPYFHRSDDILTEVPKQWYTLESVHEYLRKVERAPGSEFLFAYSIDKIQSDSLGDVCHMFRQYTVESVEEMLKLRMRRADRQSHWKSTVATVLTCNRPILPEETMDVWRWMDTVITVRTNPDNKIMEIETMLSRYGVTWTDFLNRGLWAVNP